MINLVRSSIINKNLTNLTRCNKRYAGHSKWANIKHDKAIKDGKRALNFNRLRRMIAIAITEGNNVNPAMNHKLAQVIDQAKKAMMPMSTINKVLLSSQATKVPTKSGLFEIRGPGGSIILAEFACENLPQLKMSINTIMKKTRCSSAGSGAQHMFDHKGIVTTELKGNFETATEHAIQADAEDVQEVELGGVKEYHFICEIHSLYNVKNKLEELNYVVKSAETMYIPHKRVELNDADLQSAISLCEKLEAIEEIIKLHDNIE